VRWSNDTIASIEQRVALGPLVLTLRSPEEARSLRSALYRRLRGFAIRLSGRTLDIRSHQTLKEDHYEIE
jgi:hypothetical protein